jgi:HlyD family secretion protein
LRGIHAPYRDCRNRACRPRRRDGIRRGANEGTLADVTTVTRTATLRSFVTASGEIVATRCADIGSASMGRLVSLSVKEGDTVKAGQVVARIDPVQAASSADSASAALRALEAEASGAGNQIKASQADLAAAEAQAADAQRALKRARDLRQAGLIAQSELDTAQARADTTAAQARAAEAAIRRLEQSLSAAERRVAQGRAEVARARDSLSKTDITAPIDGVVTRLDVEEGEMVVIGVQNQPGTILMTISDLSSINAEVKVAEADVLRLALGNTAAVTLEALTGTTGRRQGGGSAPATCRTQARRPAAREFRVKVRLEATRSEAFVLASPATPRSWVAERSNVLTVPLQAGGPAHRAVQFTEVASVVTDGVARFTPAKTGIIGGLTVEIDAVPEGATIVAGPFQVLREIQDGERVRTR